MIRIFLLLGFIFYSLPSLAKVVTAKGKYMHSGEISTNEGCELAKEKAKLKALEKELGQTISSEELEKCSQIDGKSNCERNQFFLSSFNGDITGLKELDRKKTTETLDNGEIIYYCEIEIKDGEFFTLSSTAGMREVDKNSLVHSNWSVDAGFLGNLTQTYISHTSATFTWRASRNTTGVEQRSIVTFTLLDSNIKAEVPVTFWDNSTITLQG